MLEVGWRFLPYYRRGHFQFGWFTPLKYFESGPHVGAPHASLGPLPSHQRVVPLGQELGEGLVELAVGAGVVRQDRAPEALGAVAPGAVDQMRVEEDDISRVELEVDAPLVGADPATPTKPKFT